MERVSFKSIPEMYEKEKSGRKNNTIRESLPLLSDEINTGNKRYSLLKKFEKREIFNLAIEIVKVGTEGKESFIRQITDVAQYKGLFIITWEHDKNYINIQEDIRQLMFLFPKSFINYNCELILIPKINLYFNLKDINTKRDLDKKMIHWVTKDCFDNNKYWNKYIAEKFNKYFKREFTEKELELIYARLGKEVNRELTEKFLDSDLNLEVLRED
ncbi:hypothetical protein AAA294_07230 [Fusobacterium varium]|uniref:hypothetical protein n=1 Tax=Fusobacterium varium TaxID=856 RepID=UPI0032C16F7D